MKHSYQSTICIEPEKNRMEEFKMKISKAEWLSLSKEIKLKLIRLAILENAAKYPSPLTYRRQQGA